MHTVYKHQETVAAHDLLADTGFLPLHDSVRHGVPEERDSGQLRSLPLLKGELLGAATRICVNSPPRPLKHTMPS
eukprot:154695-Hanusia_phi.AAC.2